MPPPADWIVTTPSGTVWTFNAPPPNFMDIRILTAEGDFLVTEADDNIVSEQHGFIWQGTTVPTTSWS